MSLSVWDDAWNRAQPTLDSMQSTLISEEPVKPRIIRVGQLDSELLDQELAQLLQEPVSKALSLINVSLKSRFDPEIRLFIQLVLYKFSVWNTGASYGAKLQDLHYAVPISKGNAATTSRIPRRTLAIHALLTLLGPYFHTRLRTYALSHAWPDAPSSDIRRKAWNLLELLESMHASLSLANFTLFLWNGRYRTLADRLLSMRLVPSRHQVRRDVSYEFMNRQMVWHAFTEFLLFFLPLIDARTVRKRFYRLAAWCSPSAALSLLPSKALSTLGISQSNLASKPQKKAKYANAPEDQCAICAENASFNPNPSEQANMFTAMALPVLDTSSSEETISPYPIHIPYITSCGHVYCYHCIAERMIRSADDGDQGWECLRCCEIVQGADRYSVEVPESDSDLNVSGSEYEFSSDLDMYTDMSGSMGSFSESALSE
ncbi:peroxisomal biogenesis factor 2 [Coprinopsis cinerea okayama7|uniref:RING-type E3 ubiquitin transferase (cysteine targeting) n=1 Tax=Coprinopsis cinerea (strain Okayama-7 / 130 / ATCC MYA-4618 / FGSC 9003) TaxID=240176 RepID=A8NXV9_COPC7|nr:peroxisomal biogenesis factor 2 [Coprinopsis cinerea okayama7\|eukprot:XP_001837282.2 peroxisomal biogenesis factor 2 [Coprinopsis cinerea okayama7\